MTDLNPYMTMSYIGANNPAISYNGVTNRFELKRFHTGNNTCLLYTSPSPRDRQKSRMPSSA